MLFSSKPREDIGQNPNFDPESPYFEIDYSDIFKYLDGSDGDSCFHKGNPSFPMSSTLESRRVSGSDLNGRTAKRRSMGIRDGSNHEVLLYPIWPGA